MTAVPEGLYPGPDVDGQATWYGPSLIPFKSGWEGRTSEGDEFEPIPGRMAAAQIVQCRPRRLPDPDGVSVVTPPGTPWRIATTVGVMRDRTDLDQWEYAETGGGGGWLNADNPMSLLAANSLTDDFPVIVRRRP